MADVELMTIRMSVDSAPVPEKQVPVKVVKQPKVAAMLTVIFFF